MHVDEAVVALDTGFVSPEGEAIQILLRQQSGELSLALLIHPVPWMCVIVESWMAVNGFRKLTVRSKDLG
jgi:hypothetical protein